MIRAIVVKTTPIPSARRESARPRSGTHGTLQTTTSPAITLLATGQNTAAATR
ncbi:hypothetical protein [Ornithinimicrobium sp. W1665]|uniref:hypothetical protein n=1 Tax=Ornithinimicrobium sp. W1665 TaxID=3416666 RepID=UPI003D6A0592